MSHRAIVDRKSFLNRDCLERPGDDPIFALNAEASKRAQAGESIVNATLGALMEDDGALAVMPSVFEALARVPPRKAAAYAPIAGEPRFLAAVVRDLFGGGALARDAVAVATPGGTGALHHAIVNFLEPGQALLTTSYYWGPYKTIADHTRRRVGTFEMFDARGGFHLEAFERALEAQLGEQGRALVLLNSPCHNPTGFALDAREWSELERIVKACSARGSIALCIDFAYARFAPGNADAWVANAERLAGDVVLLVAWTASKAFAQYGARVGALVAAHPDPAERKRIHNALAFSCRGTWSNCNHGGQLAVADLLELPDLARRADDDRARLRKLLFERVEAFNLHARRAGLRYPRYEGGFFVTVFCERADAVAKRMRDDGVFVVPQAGGVRVALCSTPARDVARLVDSMARAIAAEPRE